MGISNSERMKRWRKEFKKRMVESFGGKCCICNNEYLPEVFDFHHLDPSEKEFQLSKVMGSPKSWKKIVAELRKCVMVCSNCHRVIHYSDDEITNPNHFNEEYAVYTNSRGQIIGN